VELADLKQAAIDAETKPAAGEAKPAASYTRDEMRSLLEEVLNQDILQREVSDITEHVAERIREGLWPEFEVEAKRKKAEKDVERKALLMHLKDLIGEANG
jgi:hypothetical protein